MDRAQILKYFIDEYFNGNLESVVQTTGYSKHQVQQWYNGKTQPRKGTVEYIAQCALAPEFRIVKEFFVFSPDKGIHGQLVEALGNHGNLSGVYAFYDSMANLLYVGKATNLLKQMYQSIRRTVPVKFPRGVEQQPKRRYEVVRYISAYEVSGVSWKDYPKHVESLMLRISKPPLNKNIGFLERLDAASDY
ncbi:MAG: hypothetical protein OXN81_03005 [Alphaproteobacteria bacterium]|nr:hypothetical protein [Alphaproteobacteria bacterium]